MPRDIISRLMETSNPYVTGGSVPGTSPASPSDSEILPQHPQHLSVANGGKAGSVSDNPHRSRNACETCR